MTFVQSNQDRQRENNVSEWKRTEKYWKKNLHVERMGVGYLAWGSTGIGGRG